MNGNIEVEQSHVDLENHSKVDDDDDYEEEEVLVHVEFDCEVDASMFNPEHTFKIVGIDAENPLMQFGDKIFQGEWRDIIGTSVFFEEDKEKKLKESDDDPFTKYHSNPVKLACHTRKSLVMSRVFIKPKPNQTQEESRTVNADTVIDDNSNKDTNCGSVDSEEKESEIKSTNTNENNEQMEIT